MHYEVMGSIEAPSIFADKTVSRIIKPISAFVPKALMAAISAKSLSDLPNLLFLQAGVDRMALLSTSCAQPKSPMCDLLDTIDVEIPTGAAVPWRATSVAE